MSFVTMMEGHLAWGDKPLLDNADLTVEAGQRIGLIGRNGTGKSSLLKVLAGIEKTDGGESAYTERSACSLRGAGALLSGSPDRHGFFGASR